MPINVSEILGFSNAKSIYSNDSIWDNRHGLTRKYPLFLSPDSISYSSRMNPVFSFEIEKHLQEYEIISLRDGVFPLLRFFFMNPIPSKSNQLLIVDEKMIRLVPPLWRNNVNSRDLYTKKQFFTVESNELLLLISPDKDNLPLDIFKNELLKNFELIEKSQVSVYFSSCHKIGEEYASEDSSWKFVVMQSLLETFPGKKIEVLDWNNVHKKRMAGVKLLEINPLHFYFTDSFLTHEFLQKGALLAGDNCVEAESFHQEDISIYHGFNIRSLPDNHQSLYDMENLKSIFPENINTEVEPKNYTDLRLTIKSFQDFATDMARQLYETGASND